MARRLAQAAAVFVLLAVAAYWAIERMNIDGVGPACAAMFSC